MEQLNNNPNIDPVAIAQRLSAEHVNKEQEAAVMARVDVTNPTSVEEYAQLHDTLSKMEESGFVYPETDEAQELPQPAEILAAKQEAIDSKDKTKQLDLRDHSRAVDVLADSIEAHPLSRRQLVDLRNQAIESKDADSVNTIDNALISKLELSRSTPLEQKAAIDKLDHLFNAKRREAARIKLAEVLALEPEPVAPKKVDQADKPAVDPVEEIIYATPETESSSAEQLKGFKFDVGIAEKAVKGEDFVLRNDKLGVFGVVDGMGGHGGGDVAAQTIGAALEEYFEFVADISDINETNAVTVMKEGFRTAHDALNRADKSGLGTYEMGAVATVVKAFKGESGENLAVYGHVGDTRLYVMDAAGNLTQVTRDEGFENTVYNAISVGGEPKLDQFGVVEIPVGSRLLLISDGISGDRDSDIMSNDEIKALLNIGDPREAAKALLNASRKNDDKSVLIVDIEPTEAPSDDGEENKTLDEAATVEEDEVKSSRVKKSLLSRFRKAKRLPESAETTHPVPTFMRRLRGNAKQAAEQAEDNEINPDDVFVIPQEATTMLNDYAALYGAENAIKLMRPDSGESKRPRPLRRARNAGRVAASSTVLFDPEQVNQAGADDDDDKKST